MQFCGVTYAAISPLPRNLARISRYACQRLPSFAFDPRQSFFLSRRATHQTEGQPIPGSRVCARSAPQAMPAIRSAVDITDLEQRIFDDLLEVVDQVS